jgi:hypothetical protein
LPLGELPAPTLKEPTLYVDIVAVYDIGEGIDPGWVYTSKKASKIKSTGGSSIHSGKKERRSPGPPAIKKRPTTADRPPIGSGITDQIEAAASNPVPKKAGAGTQAGSVVPPTVEAATSNPVPKKAGADTQAGSSIPPTTPVEGQDPPPEQKYQGQTGSHSAHLHADQLSHFSKTYQVNWLRSDERLRKKIPNSRVLEFSYPKPDEKPDLTPAQYLKEVANRLILCISETRLAEQSSRGPMVFVGHGFGGIVLLQAIALLKKKESENQGNPVSPQILELTAGTILFDSPHQNLAKEIPSKDLDPKASWLKWFAFHYDTSKCGTIIDAKLIWDLLSKTMQEYKIPTVWYHTRNVCAHYHV